MEHTKLPELAVGYMNQGHGHGHYAVIVAETNELLDVRGLDKDCVELIVRACNRDEAFEDLLAACEAWMKVESESKTSTPCPDYNLRAIYRKEAVKLSEAAIKKAGK